MRIIQGLVLISVILGTQACNMQRNDSPKLADPFDASGEKVRLDLFALRPSGDPAQAVAARRIEGRPTLSSGRLESGFDLAVLADEQCLRRRATNGVTQLLRNSITLPATSSRSPLQTYKVTLPSEMTITQLKGLSEGDRCIQGVSHNRTATTSSLVSDDPLLAKQVHLSAIRANNSYKLFFDETNGIRRPVVIAVIDTGIDTAHSDLRPNLWVNEIERNGQTGVDDDGNGYVDDIHGYNFPSRIGDPAHETVNDHGTHVAGLAAAASSNGVGGMGIMGSQVRIMALNVFGSNWGAETVHIDEGIRYAADNGANIINISVGGSGLSDTTAAALVYALNKGSLVVVAAGNLNKDIGTDFYFPASYAAQYPGLIAVAATDSRTGELCDFSNFGSSTVSIAAPGCDKEAFKAGLLSTRTGNEYGYKKGTSMSAPLVSGAAGLIYGWLRDRGETPPPGALEDWLVMSSERSSVLDPSVRGGRWLNLELLAQTLELGSKPQQ